MVGPASRVSRALMTGPVAPFADVYGLELKRRCYAPLTAVNQLRQVARLSRWLEVRGLAAAELTGERVDEFLAFQRATGRYRAQWSRPGLLCLLDVLREQGVAPLCVQVPVASDEDMLLGSFARYLLSERGLATGTVCGYLAHARRFLDGLSPSAVAEVTAGEVTAAVLREADGGGSVSTVQNFVAALRAFLRFCFLEGLLGICPVPRWPSPVDGAHRRHTGSAGQRHARCWPAATGAPRWGGGTTRSSSPCCDWACGAASSPR